MGAGAAWPTTQTRRPRASHAAVSRGRAAPQGPAPARQWRATARLPGLRGQTCVSDTVGFSLVQRDSHSTYFLRLAPFGSMLCFYVTVVFTQRAHSCDPHAAWQRVAPGPQARASAAARTPRHTGTPPCQPPTPSGPRGGRVGARGSPPQAVAHRAVRDVLMGRDPGRVRLPGPAAPQSGRSTCTPPRAVCLPGAARPPPASAAARVLSGQAVARPVGCGRDTPLCLRGALPP